uniref:Uncharacterized protein n=1 Tax=Rhodnius prolixus TaxID=13249 RepID=T1HZC5_RHOPR
MVAVPAGSRMFVVILIVVSFSGLLSKAFREVVLDSIRIYSAARKLGVLLGPLSCHQSILRTDYL